MATVQDTKTELTAEQAQRIAEGFILDRIGDQVTAGPPWLVRSALGAAWVMPLILTSSAYGLVGGVGAIVVDMDTAQVIASTPLELLQTNADRLLKEQHSEIEAAFRSAVTGKSAA